MSLDSDHIDYEIREDGTCSYCGREAGWQETPGGDLVLVDRCYFCDEFNLEAEMEAIEDWIDEGDRSGDADV